MSKSKFGVSASINRIGSPMFPSSKGCSSGSSTPSIEPSSWSVGSWFPPLGDGRDVSADDWPGAGISNETDVFHGKFPPPKKEDPPIYCPPEHPQIKCRPKDEHFKAAKSACESKGQCLVRVDHGMNRDGSCWYSPVCSDDPERCVDDIADVKILTVI